MTEDIYDSENLMERELVKVCDEDKVCSWPLELMVEKLRIFVWLEDEALPVVK